MFKIRPTLLALLTCTAVLVITASCGGGNASKDSEGAAGVATADYFVQEAQGNKLPEGVNVTSVGAKSITPLGVSSDQKKQSITLRYCVLYAYREKTAPFNTHNRVYITSRLKDGKWSIESVKDDGTCEGVS